MNLYKQVVGTLSMNMGGVQNIKNINLQMALKNVFIVTNWKQINSDLSPGDSVYDSIWFYIHKTSRYAV